MTRVNSGVLFEYDIRNHYQAKGFEVMRAAGSRGAADILAWNEEEVYLIQAKKEKRKYPKYGDDIKKLRDTKAPSSWRKLLIVKNNQDVFIYDCTQETIQMQQMKIGDFRGN